MNYKLLIHTQGQLVLIEAALMLPALLIALIYGDGDAMSFVYTILLMLLIGLPLFCFVKPEDKNLKARDGFVIVAGAWALLSLFGALPLMFSGLLPNFFDAFFESISGFTTTGATVMTNFVNAPHGVMFWRSFTHWIGGMGILVFTLALMPKVTGRASMLVRAESAGPSMSKLVPKMGNTAKILYVLYAGLTLVLFIALMMANMSPYDALIHAVGTAGTGGFSNYAQSVGAFNSPVINVIITVFMLLFSVNFALYYKILFGSWKEAFRMEEMRWFFGMVVICIVLVTALITPLYHNVLSALNHGSFQVASIVSTSGFATADFDLWPQSAKVVLLFLLCIGGCAGSTAGGLKVVRLGILVKNAKRSIVQAFQPRKTKVVRFENKGLDESMISSISTYFFLYVALIIVGTLLVSLDGRFDFQTNFTAALTTVNNVGPGLGAIGPTGGFSGYSNYAKAVFAFLMLAGRLEIYPMLVLLTPMAWRKQ